MDRQLKWDRRFLEVARLVASWSKDPSTKVGAVIVDENNHISGTGYNGFRPGHIDAPELYANREYKYKHVLHAEAAALSTWPSPVGLGSTLYSSFPCCPQCVGAAGQRGIRRLVFPKLPTEGRDPAWIEFWVNELKEAERVAGLYEINLVVLEDV